MRGTRGVRLLRQANNVQSSGKLVKDSSHVFFVTLGAAVFGSVAQSTLVLRCISTLGPGLVSARAVGKANIFRVQPSRWRLALSLGPPSQHVCDATLRGDVVQSNK
ncbi:hypothetical protein BU23DRAFT_570338 [Bimuria novae-zelandiae CBS 107.79]|uniref:Uncharacterized protein n=1 Tax=Bimuria novae-zelandiae CBS 107.79 TaxID=1447943 RepID=A0A6A5V7U8_9PLEO|nr:hypothetical protein BU23DRAFT_570338 [Bimuria novae-zelandiae CBS 107.79]